MKLPYEVDAADDILFKRYESTENLPLKLPVRNIDGSVTERSVLYTLQAGRNMLGGSRIEYAYVIEGTALSGYVVINGEDVVEAELPETIGEAANTGNPGPKDEIKRVPDPNVETIIPSEIQDPEEEWIALNMVNGETEISVEAFPELQNPQELTDVFYKVLYQNPYILGAYSFQYDYGSLLLKVVYCYDRDTIHTMQEEIREKSDSVLEDIIKEGMSDEEKRNAIYNYLTENGAYDQEALEYSEQNGFKKTQDNPYEKAFNTYGIMVENKGVCMSYAYSFKLLCDRSNVECMVATGMLNGNLPHAWNFVSIDGQWYQTDSTNNKNTCGIPFYL